MPGAGGEPLVCVLWDEYVAARIDLVRHPGDKQKLMAGSVFAKQYGRSARDFPWGALRAPHVEAFLRSRRVSYWPPLFFRDMAGYLHLRRAISDAERLAIERASLAKPDVVPSVPFLIDVLPRSIDRIMVCASLGSIKPVPPSRLGDVTRWELQARPYGEACYALFDAVLWTGEPEEPILAMVGPELDAPQRHLGALYKSLSAALLDRAEVARFLSAGMDRYREHHLAALVRHCGDRVRERLLDDLANPWRGR